MKSKEAQSFGTLGPQNSMTKNMMMGTTKSFLHASDSSSLAFNKNPYQQNIGIQANASQNTVKTNI